MAIMAALNGAGVCGDWPTAAAAAAAAAAAFRSSAGGAKDCCCRGGCWRPPVAADTEAWPLSCEKTSLVPLRTRFFLSLHGVDRLLWLEKNCEGEKPDALAPMPPCDARNKDMPGVRGDAGTSSLDSLALDDTDDVAMAAVPPTLGVTGARPSAANPLRAGVPAVAPGRNACWSAGELLMAARSAAAAAKRAAAAL